MTSTPAPLLAKVESLLVQARVTDAAAEALAIVEAARALAEPADHASRATAMAVERAAGTPLAYVLGTVRFMGLDLVMAPGALVPRSETELLGWTAVNRLSESTTQDGPARLVDMCCGSGNLVCGIATRRSGVKAWACDLTDQAIRVARVNVDRLGLANRVEVLQSDLFTGLDLVNLRHTIDMVVCNPPYISTGKLDRERADLLAHEPREAFDGGPYGVNIFQRVIRDAADFLKPGGTLLLEIGVGQERQVSRLFERTGRYDPAVAFTDAANCPRVVAGITRR